MDGREGDWNRIKWGRKGRNGMQEEIWRETAKLKVIMLFLTAILGLLWKPNRVELPKMFIYMKVI